MLLDRRLHYTLAPLVLRLALAAIFIYHGNQKVFGINTDLGANWAAEQWARQGAIPRDFEERIRQAPKASQEAKTEVLAGVADVYARQAPAPPSALTTWHWTQYAVAWGELLGGIALLVGLLTRVAALGLIVIQAGAIWTVTGTQGFSLAQGGYEYNVALLAMCVALVVMGGGTWAVDRFFRRSTSKAPAAAQQKVAVPA
ncbi:MAG TPA: DoxX family protein [Gemmataceae bacterium]|jgi:uncharacterized membrane protein YphA (DoxX/SURF4 family)|nr:DoxX family protein [Gemmataceae bacterium]